MRPRLIFRTHYQVDEPAYVEFLIKACTSPVQSAYTEVVADRLAHEIRLRTKRDFNPAAGAYAVDLGSALGVLTKNNTWTELGHLVGLLASLNDPDDLSLTNRERILHFRLFLEADGAVLIEIAKHLLDLGSLSHAQALREPFVEELFGRIFRTYLSLTISTSERVRLRAEAERIQKEGYRPKTRQHKLDIHLRTLFRLGFVDRDESRNEIVYRVTEKTVKPLQGLVREMPSIETMEKRLEKEDLILFAARLYGMGGSFSSCNSEQLAEVVGTTYLDVMGHGTPLCPIPTLVEATQVRMLTDHDIAVAKEEVIIFLRRQQQLNPKELRFHVDRKGQPSFIKISKAWLASVVK